MRLASDVRRQSVPRVCIVGWTTLSAWCALDYPHRGLRGHQGRERETGGAEDGFEFGARPYPTTSAAERHEHDEIRHQSVPEAESLSRLVCCGHHPVHEHEFALRSDDLSAVLKGQDGLTVVPIQHEIGENVSISTGGHSHQRIATDESAARGETHGVHRLPDAFGETRDVEDDPGRLRIGGQDLR